MKSMKLGGGGRFQKGVQEIMSSEGYTKERASAIMAAAGRKKYGALKMRHWAAAGKKRSHA